MVQRCCQHDSIVKRSSRYISSQSFPHLSLEFKPHCNPQNFSFTNPYQTSSFIMSKLPTSQLGKNGPLIPKMGLGCMGLSIWYGARAIPDEERLQFLDGAFELGETFWVTSDRCMFLPLSANPLLVTALSSLHALSRLSSICSHS